MMKIIHSKIDLINMTNKRNQESEPNRLKNNHLKVYFNKNFKFIIIELFLMLKIKVIENSFIYKIYKKMKLIVILIIIFLILKTI